MGRRAWAFEDPEEVDVPDPTPYLEVRDLTVRFQTEDGTVRAVNGVSFTVEPGRTLGIVGESGSGKSVASLAVLGLHNPRRTKVGGQILVGGRDIVGLADDQVRKLRGRKMAMIFQDPLSALHPYYTVGRQVAEAYRVHHPSASRVQARARAVAMLGRVGIPQPDKRFDRYPHEFSGGMRQRVMIAMALVNDPDLLIADEPTTALDVTVQAQILDLLADLQAEFNTAIVLITHDLGIVAEMAQRVVVMYAGRKVEEAPVAELFARPRHPYTRGLLDSIPKLGMGSAGGAATRLSEIAGTVPSLAESIVGCAFAPRCAFATSRCRSEYPPLEEKVPGHRAACWESERMLAETVA